jgi:DNA primase
LLIKETYKNSTKGETKADKIRPVMNTHNDMVELHFIQLMMEYPQKITQVENENILDYFLQSELRNLGRKIIDAYKLLGFIDVGVILSADENSALRERIFQLMIKALPPDDMMLEKIFTDNVRQIKKKWYKEQHRQIKIKLSKAQENGNDDMISKLLYEKENILIKEKELH